MPASVTDYGAADDPRSGATSLAAWATAVAAALDGDDTTVDARVSAHASDTTSVHGIADTADLATSAEIAALGLVAPPLVSVVTAAQGTTPIPVDAWGGYTWGVYSTGIYRSSDEGATWSLHATAPVSDVLRVLPTSDGEVVAVAPATAYKSSGWAGGSPTFTLKATANGSCSYLEWGFASDTTGDRFILTDYSSSSRADSRYVLMSLDAGTTWTTVYDSVAVHGATLANSSHLHGCTYDAVGDRWYFVEGHDDGGTTGDIAGIYCSTDDGATWARADGMAMDPGPTAIVATPDGLVCGSDNVSNGLYGVQRRDDPSDEELVRTWAWNTGRAGLVGFARRGSVQPDTGIVYMGWTSGYSDVAPIITAGTATSGAIVYTWDGAWSANDHIAQALFTSAHKLSAYVSISGTKSLLTAWAGAPGASSVLDDGHVLGGTAASGDGLAVGPQSAAGTGIRNTAVGVSASTEASVQDAVAIGYNASASQDGVAIGSQVATSGNGVVAVGRSANNNGFSQTVSVGYNVSHTGAASVGVGWGATAGNAGTSVGATAVGGAGVAVGYAATVGGTTGVSIGRASATNQGSGVALGYQATANHAEAVALRTQTTAANQVAIGAKHIEVTESASDPAAPAANAARLYVRDDGAGKTQLCVRFASGAVQVIATEP